MNQTINDKVLIQIYNKIMFRTAFMWAYYGLMRISEYTKSQHVVKAKDVQLSRDKRKLKLYLRSSKTHDTGMKPQEIKIEEDDNILNCFSPLEETRKFLEIRPAYQNNEEQFFVYRNREPLTAQDIRNLLKYLIKKLNLNADLYDTHSFRIGRATDLFKMNYSIEEIKQKGRWKIQHSISIFEMSEVDNCL